jgi:cysteine desulfurase
VLETFKLLKERKLAQISIIPVQSNGIVDPKKIKKELRKETILVSVMYANNEIGTIQPLKEIAREIRHYIKMNSRKNIFFHTDATQAEVYLDLSVESLGVDLLTLSGSKIKDALGVGVLYKKKNVPFANVFGGGNQENGFRPGTENLPSILKFTKAFLAAQEIKDSETKRLTKLRDYFFTKLSTLSRLNLDMGIVVNGDMNNRLPNNINLTIPNIPSDLLVIELSEKGVMASAKSACKAGDGKCLT